MSAPAGPITDQTDTLTEDTPADAEGKDLLWLRWCHPLPAHLPLALDAQKRTVGRDAGCDASLPSGHVSRVHAEIRRSGPVCTVFDLQSKNGVFVNGQRVPRAVLHPGDVLRVGDYVAVVVKAPSDADLRFSLVTPEVAGGHRHRAVFRRMGELMRATLPVVLEGATGTGKELLARAIHEQSGRRGAFLPVNCAVYSRTMAAAELFGFKKGAFTGAEQSSLGHLRTADGGTLFLDEILELMPEVQAMLLRVLERSEVHPLGENRPVPVDVRFVVATQIPLAEAVAQGRFRADLRARLEGAVVELPRLSECREIVPELLVELHRRRRGERTLELSAPAAEALCLHDWSLNVRELDMLARRLATRGDEQRIEVADLELRANATMPPEGLDAARGAAVAVEVPGRRPSSAPYDPAEVEQLRRTLERHAGNMSRAVAELGISRARAYRMLGQKPTS